jgi:hypothetical protein
MVDPKPLFDEEEPPDAPQAGPVVMPLDLPDDPMPDDPMPHDPLALPDDLPAPLGQPVRHPAVVALDLPPDAPQQKAPSVRPAIAAREHPFVASAMARGETLFPDLMRDQAFQVRNLLGELIPLDVPKLTDFAADTLQRVAALVDAVAALDQRFHEIDAETLINGIVERARSHAAHAKRSLVERISGLVPFDERAARHQVEAIRRAIAVELVRIADALDTQARLNTTLTLQAAVLAILNDMGDHGAMGDWLSRRGSLLDASRQELDIMGRQIEALRLLARQWMMRCDEVHTIILPALGFSATVS